MTTLAIICGVLAVFVALNFFLVFALIGRLRVIQEHIATTSPSRDPDLLPVGQAIAPFAAVTHVGDALTEAALEDGSTLVGFFAPHCRPCKVARETLLASPIAMPLVAFVEGTAADDDARAVADELGPIARVAFAGDNASVAKAFKPTSYPTFVRVQDGLVTAAGHRLSEVL